MHTGLCVVLGPVEADVPTCFPRIRYSKGLLTPLIDAGVLVGGALDGGLGMVWHTGEGGCGFITVFKVCRVSSENLCSAGSLEERNQIENKFPV